MNIYRFSPPDPCACCPPCSCECCECCVPVPCPCLDPAGSADIPVPGFGNFYSNTAQTIIPDATYGPINLSADYANVAHVSEDGFSLVFDREGLYLVGFGIIPQSGAGSGARVAVVQPALGSPPPAIYASIRPVVTNLVETGGQFLAYFNVGDSIYLGVHADTPVTLFAGTGDTAVNAYLSLACLGRYA